MKKNLVKYEIIVPLIVFFIISSTIANKFSLKVLFFNISISNLYGG